ncbi:MAG: hypothetical protein GY701_21545 [Sulfitobacter sp.]|nr:hypothetical protein [Sulfitobacter sp.]
MRALERPNPEHIFDPGAEIAGLLAHRDNVPADPAEDRRIPPPTAGHVLLGSWNIANLGVHKRRPSDWDVIAELLSWFEIVAIQEIADDRSDLEAVLGRLPGYFSVVFNDRAGNDERAAFVFDTRRVTLGPKIGEVVIVESDRKHVKLDGIDRKFGGFNRNPYIATFTIENTDLLIANCHLLWGPDDTAAQKKASREKRQLEAYAIARWCDLRRNDKHRYTRHILAMGDFNLPQAEPGDPIFDALTKRGLKIEDVPLVVEVAAGGGPGCYAASSL